MRLGIDAAKKAGGVCEAVVCYSGDVASSKEKKYTLQYYLDFVDQLVKEGIHILAIKDMAGLLKPEAAKMSDELSLRPMPRCDADTQFCSVSLGLLGKNTPIFRFTFTLTIQQVLLLPV